MLLNFISEVLQLNSTVIVQGNQFGLATLRKRTNPAESHKQHGIFPVYHQLQ